MNFFENLNSFIGYKNPKTITEQKPFKNNEFSISSNEIYLNQNKKNGINNSQKNKKQAPLFLDLNNKINSNTFLDNIYNEKLKKEYNHRPQDNSTSKKDEIGKLMSEIKKLKDVMSDFKYNYSDNKRLNNSENNQPNTQSLPSNKIVFNKNKLNNNINPFNEILFKENNYGQSFNNNFNNISFNDEEEIISSENNYSFQNQGFFKGMNYPFQNSYLNKFPNTRNNFIPYGSNNEYCFNSNYIPFYEPNLYNNPIFPIKENLIFSRPQFPEIEKRKKNKKKK